MEVTAIEQEEVKALVRLCAFDYYELASKVMEILFFKKKNKGSKFPLPKPEIKTPIHAETREQFADVDVNHLLALPFSEGEVDDIRDAQERNTSLSIT